jgi:hypothetical protein
MRQKVMDGRNMPLYYEYRVRLFYLEQITARRS